MRDNAARNHCELAAFLLLSCVRALKRAGLIMHPTTPWNGMRCCFSIGSSGRRKERHTAAAGAAACTRPSKFPPIHPRLRAMSCTYVYVWGGVGGDLTMV